MIPTSTGVTRDAQGPFREQSLAFPEQEHKTRKLERDAKDRQRSTGHLRDISENMEKTPETSKP